MIVTPLSLPDVLLLEPKRFEDSRGYFSETYTQSKFEPYIPGLVFVQDNESYSIEIHTVRGLHYQSPPHAQDKLVRVVKGRILDVVVDIRTRSSSYGKWASAELSAENGKQLFVPKGFLHGFMTLEPDTIVNYKVTDFYVPESDGVIFWNSKALQISWPADAGKVVLSEKDAHAGDFSSFSSPF